MFFRIAKKNYFIGIKNTLINYKLQRRHKMSNEFYKMSEYNTTKISNELKGYLHKRYPELSQYEKSIDYSGKNPNWSAVVTYYIPILKPEGGCTEQRTILEYKESNNGSRYWYCSHDWKD